MTRSILVTLFALGALAAMASPARAQGVEAAAGPRLKAAVTVTGEIVRIGDLVDNAGAVADVPIFRAPDPGQTGSVPLASMLEAVRGHHLLGLDTQGLAEVAVTRAARTISARDLEARILGALAGKYAQPASGDLAVVFDSEVRSTPSSPSSDHTAVVWIDPSALSVLSATVLPAKRSRCDSGT